MAKSSLKYQLINPLKIRSDAPDLDFPAAQMLAPPVKEEIIFGFENLGLSISEIDRRTDSALYRFGLDGMQDRAPHTLSGGEQQKLALAAITARQPSSLVLDEP